VAEGGISSIFTAMAAECGVKKGIILSKRQSNDDVHTGDTFWDSGNRLERTTFVAYNVFFALILQSIICGACGVYLGVVKTHLKSFLDVRGNGGSHIM